MDAARVARCVYDHKGRLVLKSGPGGSERYLYGADDGLLAVADGAGEPRMIFLRLPTGIVGMIDFRFDPRGRIVCLHNDTQGNLIFAGSAEGDLEGPFASDPYGLPLQPDGRTPYLYRGRVWHGDLGLYRIGCRWYDPSLRRFLSLDNIPARRTTPARQPVRHRAAAAHGAREMLAGGCRVAAAHRQLTPTIWSRLRPERPLERRRRPVVGARRTVDAPQWRSACHRGECLLRGVRWLVWAVTAGHVSWQTGFDVASSSA